MRQQREPSPYLRKKADLSRVDAHRPTYIAVTLGHVPARQDRYRMVPDVRYTMQCKCGFRDTTVRTKTAQREIFKNHILATVGHL